MKRFSDTARFSEPWYFGLPPEMKVAWEYLWAMCDNSGVWTPNFPLADMQIGKKVDWDKFTLALEGRVFRLENSKWFMPDFVKIQCGKLNPNSPPHMAIIRLLRGHGLIEEDGFEVNQQGLSNRLLEGLSKGLCNSPKEKEEETDQDKEEDKTRAGANLPTVPEALRIAAMVGRKPTTAWSDKEVRAFKSLMPIHGDDLTRLERYYAAQRAKGEAGWHRRDVATFLNNFAGELDRASGYAVIEKPAPATPRKTLAQFIGEAGARKMRPLPGDNWPKRADGTDETTDNVGKLEYNAYIQTL